MKARRVALARPAVFGIGDGCMSIVGVILYLLGDPRVIFATVLAGSISAALSMAGNDYLSDSDDGLLPSAVMGLATFAGGLAPALPFLFTRGRLALILMGVICLLLGVLVGVIRAQAATRHSFRVVFAGTLVIFALIFGAVLAVALGLPSPAG